MKIYPLIAILALAVPQIGAIEPDNCAELAEQLRDEQAKIERLKKENGDLWFEKYSLERDALKEQCHNEKITEATRLATIAATLSGLGFATAETFASHLSHLCPKSLAAVGGATVFCSGGTVALLLGVPTLVRNAMDPQRPAAERLGSFAAAAMGIAPAAVYAYLVGPGLLACLSNLPCYTLAAIK